MAKRNSKTAAQQCRYYEVDNIFEYMGKEDELKEILKECRERIKAIQI